MESARGALDVVGAGVIGSAIAWRAARAGHRVRLCDPLLAAGAAQTGASWAAGGMLAPFSEGRPGEDAVAALGEASLRRWPAFADDLREATGVDVTAGRGTLMVAADGADADEIRAVAGWLGGRGAPEGLSRAAVRERHPALAKNLRGGLWLPGERAVDNRALLTTLRTAAVRAGVRVVPERYAPGAARRVVVTAGAAAPGLLPGLPVRAVKGEILRLRRPAGVPAPPECTVRAGVHGRHVYLVPRADGLVVGATMYEHGDDRGVTVGGLRDLLADAQAVLPSIAEYTLADAMAGLRPMTPDNLPALGPVARGALPAGTFPPGAEVFAATGHGRNGVLLAPVTADAVLAALEGRALPEAEGLGPERFG